MKIKEKYYPVNNQEDEDGYSLYPGSAMLYEETEYEQNINNSNSIANEGYGLKNLKAGNVILTTSERLK